MSSRPLSLHANDGRVQGLIETLSGGRVPLDREGLVCFFGEGFHTYSKSVGCADGSERGANGVAYTEEPNLQKKVCKLYMVWRVCYLGLLKDFLKVSYIKNTEAVLRCFSTVCRLVLSSSIGNASSPVTGLVIQVQNWISYRFHTHVFIPGFIHNPEATLGRFHSCFIAIVMQASYPRFHTRPHAALPKNPNRATKKNMPPAACCPSGGEPQSR